MRLLWVEVIMDNFDFFVYIDHAVGLVVHLDSIHSEVVQAYWQCQAAIAILNDRFLTNEDIILIFEDGSLDLSIFKIGTAWISGL